MVTRSSFYSAFNRNQGIYIPVDSRKDFMRVPRDGGLSQKSGNTGVLPDRTGIIWKSTRHLTELSE